MCLILCAWQVNPAFPLILAANRDELHARPSAAAHWWPDAPEIYGGRDLVAGGSWLACHRDGRFAALTNFRDLRSPPRSGESRGALVRDYLTGSDSPLAYLRTRAAEIQRWADFNLLVGDRHTLAYLASKDGQVRSLDPGCYGLSNHVLDTPWPKVARGSAALREIAGTPALSVSAAQAALLAVLSDRRPGPESELPDTGLPRDRERLVSATMIIDAHYGTRCSSVLVLDSDSAWHGIERSFAPDGTLTGECSLSTSG